MKQVISVIVVAMLILCSVEVIADSCQKYGSHDSIAWIKRAHKNCSKCGTQKNARGEKVYYCYCCDNKKSKTKNSTTSTTSAKTQTTTCNVNQYLVKEKCTTCPTNAKCNGKTATCNTNYTKSEKNGVVTCTAKTNSNTGKKCVEEGSHVSISYIKKSFKNCSKCRTENVAAGKCSKNTKAHKHYYCMCGEGCQNSTTSTTSTKTQTTTCNTNQYLVKEKCTTCPTGAKCNGKTATCNTNYTKSEKNGVVTCTAKTNSNTGKKCVEEGSHVSISYIKKSFKNCSKCRTENVAAGKCSKNTKAHKHYYCTCGEGCSAATTQNSQSIQTTSVTFSFGNPVKVNCKKNEFHTALNEGTRETDCYACPKFATCDGSVLVKCNAGFRIQNSIIIFKKEGKTYGFTIPQCVLISCPANFKTCSMKDNGEISGTCEAGYATWSYNGKCIKCPANFKSCSVDNNGEISGTCETGYATSPYNGRCIKCPTGAKTCSVSNGEVSFVSACLEGYKRSADRKGCVKE